MALPARLGLRARITFAFAATTGAVRNHHFEAVYEAFVLDEDVRAFFLDNNAPAFREMTGKLAEAIERGLWSPRSNSATFDLDRFQTEKA